MNPAHMALQVALFKETRVTNRAFEPPIVLMVNLMVFELCCTEESLFTKVTMVSLFRFAVDPLAVQFEVD